MSDPTAALQGLVAGSREFLRDFPLFFEFDSGVLDTTTIRLPHPLVSSTALQVVTFDEAGAMVQVPADKLQLDQRNGLLKFTDSAYFGQRVMANGYHYSWFLDADLGFHAQRSLLDIAYGQAVNSMDDFSPIEKDTIILGTVVSALWSLATELALDIDVSTPEGMYIPARQRYAQVIQMWQSWENELKQRKEDLNLGTGKLEVFWLRRVARLTNRLVPVYREREFDSRRRPIRLYPAIPYGVSATDRTPQIIEVGRLGQEIDWETIGTSGGEPSGPPLPTTGWDEVAVQGEEPDTSSVVLWIDTD